MSNPRGMETDPRSCATKRLSAVMLLEVGDIEGDGTGGGMRDFRVDHMTLSFLTRVKKYAMLFMENAHDQAREYQPPRIIFLNHTKIHYLLED